jgi:hypothetical protein
VDPKYNLLIHCHRCLLECTKIEGVSKGHPFSFGILFISFAPPKEMNQRKGGRKRQPHTICPPATQGLNDAIKQCAVRTFSGLPSRAIYG